MNETVVPAKAKIWMDDSAILHMQMLPKSNIDAQAAQDICEEAAKISKDAIHCNLVDIRKMTFMNKDARSVFGSQDKSSVLAVAIVNNSMLHKSLVNLYFKFSKPKIPTKVFDDHEKAREWLMEKFKD